MKFARDLNRLQIRAALDTAKKIRLEPKLASDMRRIFKSLIKDFVKSYPKTHETITPYHYLVDTTGALRKHYRLVTKSFKSSHRDELATKPDSEGKAKKPKKRDISAAVDEKMAPYIIQHSEKQAKIIMKTTQDQLGQEIQKAVKKAADSGEPIDSTGIAKTVGDEYLKRINGRVKTIAMTETQNIAEKVKDTELQEMNDDSDDGEFYAGRGFKRVWVAILDDRTRDWHAEADGQEVGIDEPFIVNGEELDYPGDPNGSDENIINCRCASLPVED